jgi:hypothetical protein
MEILGSSDSVAWSLAVLFVVWCLKLAVLLGKMNRRIKELEEQNRQILGIGGQQHRSDAGGSGGAIGVKPSGNETQT